MDDRRVIELGQFGQPPLDFFGRHLRAQRESQSPKDREATIQTPIIIRQEDYGSEQQISLKRYLRQGLTG
jgi:hypothetical protein